jgi:hypothetical protein
MAKATRTYIHNDAGGMAGYIKRWNGRWHAIAICAGSEWRCGAYADRAEAISAVLDNGRTGGAGVELPVLRH